MTIETGGIVMELARKDIARIRIRILPPDGRAAISAPRHMGVSAISAFATAKLAWIRKHQARMREQAREAPPEYVDREIHRVWGRRVLLKVAEADGAPRVWLGQSVLNLRIRPGTDAAGREARLAAWYREELALAVPPLLAAWEKRLKVKVKGFSVRRMKTRWGSCSTNAATIRLNTALAKKPRECLEYVLVHELVHLLEASHDARFTGLMDKYLPQWRQRRELLNRPDRESGGQGPEGPEQ